MSRSLALASLVLLALNSMGCPGGGSVPAPRVVAISVNPHGSDLAPGGAQLFTATVTGPSNTNVIWSVQEGGAGGAITSAGLYTAPAAAGSYHVVATSVADKTKSAIAAINVHVVVSVTPASVTLKAGQPQTFAATVAGTNNQGITWGIQEGGSGGSIDASGHYLAPVQPGVYHVTAISQADSSQSGSATVVVPAGSASGTVQ